MSSWSVRCALVTCCLLVLCSGFINAQSNLRISSDGVEYTNDTLYAPFGSSLVLTCEGGVGEERWYTENFDGAKAYLGTDSSATVYQSSGQLFVGDFQSRQAENIFCEDEVLSTVFTALTEGVVISSATASSTSITVFWEPYSPSMNMNMDMDIQALCCMVEQPDMCSNSNEVRITAGNVSVEGLEEFTMYSCRIARFSVPFVATTLSDKPSSPPEGVQLVPVDSTSLRLEWGPPPKLKRNGIITQYIVKCIEIASVQSPVILTSPTFDTPTTVQQLLTGLTFFTNYSCRVAAANVNGSGPFSAWVTATTPEGLPGAVSAVNTSQVSDEVVLVDWDAPEEPNGILQRYVLVYREYDSSSSDVEVNVPLPATSYNVSGLTAGVPYSVVVHAVTGGGRGAESERVTFFSRELAPTVAVSGVTATREGDTSMTVSWTELTLQEAQGFPVYTVLYEPSAGPVGRVSRQATPVSGVAQPPVTVGGLDPASEYTVQVRVDTDETAARESGLVSESVVAPLFPSPPTAPLSTPTSPVAAATSGVLVTLVVIGVGIILAVAAVLLLIRYRRNRKQSFNIERGSDAPDGKRSMSQDNTSWDAGSKSELVTSGVERSPSADGDVVVCAPPVPKRESRGELVLPTLSLDPTSGQSTVRDSPDEDELLVERIEKLTVPDISKERQYMNLLPPTKAKNFVNTVRKMRQDNTFSVEYHTLPFRDFTATQDAGLANLAKNRYRKVIPYDHSRVRLSGQNDYINASYISGHDKKKRYIASQGPKMETIGDFWQMVWEHKSTVIVMLTKLDEKGRSKCAQYWSDTVSDPYDVGNGLVVTLLEVSTFADYEVKTFSLGEVSGAGSHLHIHHFQFTVWPDHGVPRYPSSVIKFVQKVQHLYSQDSQAPMVVHCSAGVGRSGTFIAVDAMMLRLKEKDSINIYEFLYSMRCDRPFMIQNVEQYIFVHDLLCDYVSSGDTSVSIRVVSASVDKLSKPVTEDGPTGFEEQFNLLSKLSRSPGSEDEKFADMNVEKNRYAARFPYQSNCLFVPGPRAVRYVNASLIDTYAHPRGFVATQMPLPSSVEDVMELVIQKQCATMVVLCSDKEMTDDGTIVKFWPDKEGQSVKFGRCTLQLVSSVDSGSFSVNNIELLVYSELRTEEHHFTLIHVHGWTEDSEPEPCVVWHAIQECEKAQKGITAPAVVMCNDGMGRTGAFICMCSEVERMKMEGSADMFQSVKAARSQRPYMVSTVEQFVFAHDVLSICAETLIPYANWV